MNYAAVKSLIPEFDKSDSWSQNLDDHSKIFRENGTSRIPRLRHAPLGLGHNFYTCKMIDIVEKCYDSLRLRSKKDALFFLPDFDTLFILEINNHERSKNYLKKSII